MIFFGKSNRADVPQDPHWVRNRRGKFHRLIHLDPGKLGLDEVGGVFVVWHSGVSPEWVYAGKTSNLSRTLDEVLDNDQIMEYQIHGGLYVTWAPILEKYRDGVVRYLYDAMDPLVDNPAGRRSNDRMIAVTLPGKE